MEVAPEGLARFFESVLPSLDERQRRLVAGATARMLGRGNVTVVASAAGMSRNTVIGGIGDLDSGPLPPGRVRAPGAGRKHLVESQPGLLAALDTIIEPCADGNLSPLRWTDKSTARLADALARMDFLVSADSVGRLLKASGYHLQPPLRAAEGTHRSPPHAARRQFREIAAEAVVRLQGGEPVVSVGICKKPAGTAGGGQGVPPPTTDAAAAASSGIYALGSAEGWVSVGDDDDVAAVLAVRAVQRWWETMGIDRHHDARRLMVVARAESPVATRRWTVELGRFASETGLELTVCRLPPGTVKWSGIEHRLFSFVMNNRPDRPVTGYRTIVELSAGSTGARLKERAELDEDGSHRATGATPAVAGFVPVVRHGPAGDWYTIGGRNGHGAQALCVK